MTGNYNKMSLEVAVYMLPKLFLSYLNTVEDGDCNKATWYERQPETVEVRISTPPTWKLQCSLLPVELPTHLLPRTHIPLKRFIKRSFIKDEINSTRLLLKELYCWAGKVVICIVGRLLPSSTHWDSHVEGEYWLPRVFHWPLQFLSGIGMWAHTYTFFKV